MFRLNRLRLPLALRVFMLGLLVFGLVMNPVLAAACEIGDASQSLAGQHQPVVAPDSQADEDCCLVQDCSACCAHVAAMVPALKVAAAFPEVASPLPVLSMEFEPTAYPVAFRPPIAG
jgi:hypothetical protein